MKNKRILAVIAVSGMLFSACENGMDSPDDGAQPPGPFTLPSSAIPDYTVAPEDTVFTPATTQPPDYGKMAHELFLEATVYRPMLEEIQAYWTNFYVSNSAPLSESTAEIVFLTGDMSITCTYNDLSITMTATDTIGPAYCFGNDVIVIPVTLTDALVEASQLDENGNPVIDAAGVISTYYVFAHEWAHNLQLEIFGEMILDDNQVTSVQRELHADCVAGVTIAVVNTVFDDKSVESILRLAELLGEEPATNHGTPADRREAVRFGMNRPFGDTSGLEQCTATYLP